MVGNKRQQCYKTFEKTTKICKYCCKFFQLELHLSISKIGLFQTTTAIFDLCMPRVAGKAMLQML